MQKFLNARLTIARTVRKFGRSVIYTVWVKNTPPLLSFLLLMLSGWVHRRQLVVIEFLQTENKILKEKLNSCSGISITSRGTRVTFCDRWVYHNSSIAEEVTRWEAV